MVIVCCGPSFEVVIKNMTKHGGKVDPQLGFQKGVFKLKKDYK
jgi:hypothetical protein